ncbi:MAG: transaldolase [Actinobacteria bacterium]|nr:transaldolase [Actinomycetota bacterium]
MRIFIDSSKLDEIKKAHSAGILDGVTTNPSLIKAAVKALKDRGENVDMSGYIKEILMLAKGLPVSLEVIGTTYDEMIEDGKKIYDTFNPVAGNVYVKIPVNPSFEEDSGKNFDGIMAIKELSSMGIPINCTLVFTPEQALLAAKAGASFVSPFAGRIDDYIRSQNGIEFNKSDYFPADGYEQGEKILEDNGIVSGIDLVGQIRVIFNNYGITETKVLAASIRNPRQAREAALAGADIATLPMDVIDSLLVHYKTIEGMKKFTEDIVPEYAELLER